MELRNKIAGRFRAIRSPFGKVRFSPDSSRMLTVTSDEVSVWDPSTLDMPALTFPDPDAVLNRASSEPIIDARWSPDGKTICWATSTAVEPAAPRRDTGRRRFIRRKRKPVRPAKGRGGDLDPSGSRGDLVFPTRIVRASVAFFTPVEAVAGS